MKRHHGAKLRGFDGHPSSPSFEGVFGRIFRTLPPARFSDDALKKLADKMVAAHEDIPTPETEIDDEENQGIDAGYTYFGQFIDHDLTFDPASSLQKQNDPNGLVDFRTPRFDLDNLYGRGPDDQPYLYETDGIHFVLGPKLTGNDKDSGSKSLQRNNPASGPKRAIIGDPRNDENVIVSQLQASFLRFHNKVADIMLAKDKNVPFGDIQQAVRWHYQYVVVNDFLPTIVGKDMLHSVLPNLGGSGTIPFEKPKLTIFFWRNEPFIPIEFSAAAYRFGHSMVRPIYRLNQTLVDRQTIFSGDETKSLNGFREFPSTWAIDWDLFFDPGGAPTTGKNRIQKSYKIDTSLVNPLGDLIIAKIVSSPPPSLALRNLERGRSFGLPSGQSVARFMGIQPIPDPILHVGKANESDTPTNPLLTDLSPEFKSNAPLWYYVLAEAQQQFVKNDTPIHLGPVGGRIVTETFIGLLTGDHHSYLSQDPCWQPFPEFQRTIHTKKGDIKEFKIRDLLKAIL